MELPSEYFLYDLKILGLPIESIRCVVSEVETIVSFHSRVAKFLHKNPGYYIHYSKVHLSEEAE